MIKLYDKITKNAIYNIIIISNSQMDCMKENITVAVLDSGIHEHIDLADKVIAFKDFINKRTYPYDDCGHGTHVCGIIAGSGVASNNRIKGVCPFAKLVVLKVLDAHGNGEIENVIKASNWILEHKNKYNIKVVNISFGSSLFVKSKRYYDLIISIEALWNAGIVVVAAAGNDGPYKSSIAIPGTSKKIITVGSIDSKEFKSGRGPTNECVMKPDLIVDGTSIISCSNKSNGYSVKSGTSMSAPLVSGAIALLLSRNDLSPKEIKIRLKKCCKKTALSDYQQGWGLLNIEQFLL